MKYYFEKIKRWWNQFRCIHAIIITDKLPHQGGWKLLLGRDVAYCIKCQRIEDLPKKSKCIDLKP